MARIPGSHPGYQVQFLGRESKSCFTPRLTAASPRSELQHYSHSPPRVSDLRPHVQDQGAGQLCSCWEPSSWPRQFSPFCVLTCDGEGYRGRREGGGRGRREREENAREKERKFSGGSSYKGPDPIMTAPLLRPHLSWITSQRPCLLIPSHQ